MKANRYQLTFKEYKRIARRHRNQKRHGQLADDDYIERQLTAQQKRRASFKWRLENRPLRTALRSVLSSTQASHEQTPGYDIVDAFIDILITLKPNCDASQQARWVGSKAGVPVDRLTTRQDFVAWFDGCVVR